MRALQYDAYGSVDRLTLRDVPSPRPVAGPLVRVTVAALNPKDALFRKGKFKVLSGRRFPKYCGVDFAGVVEAPYGDLRAGDAVFGALSEWRYARGTLAEFVAPRATEVARIPTGVAEADAVAVALVGLTALQALRDVAHVGRGTSVLINGASGGVGTVAVQLARILGTRVTHGLERRDDSAVPFARRGRAPRLHAAGRSARRCSLRRGVGLIRQPALRPRASGPATARCVRLGGAHSAAARARARDALLVATRTARHREAEPRGPDAARRVAR
jgi:hypothetical protein